MLFASIFVPDFPVEALLRVEPELRSQRVAVLEGKPPLQKIFAVNKNARHAGLESGMTRLQAEAWPDLAIRCRCTLQEAAAHAALLDCAQAFSPRVEDNAPDTVVLDISGTESLFGPPAQLAHDLAQRASHLGLEANVAVAPNPDAATIAARGYSGVTILTPENQEERLGHLPLHVLFPRDSKEKEEEAQQFLHKLERWGVRTLRAFAKLPEVAISERLGQEGVFLQKLARGANSRSLVPVDPVLVFEEAVELEHPLILLEPLAFLLNRLLEQLCARLAARALATQELQLKLELDPCMQADSEIPNNAIPRHCDSKPNFPSEGFQPESRDLMYASRVKDLDSEVVIPSGARNLGSFNHYLSATNHSKLFIRTLHLPVPMLDPKIFLKLLQLDLRAHPPGAPITKIWLTAESARLRPGQAGLFIPPSPEPEKLELTMARISSIVGESNVGSLELLDTYHPEGFRMRHFTPCDLTAKKNGRSGKQAKPVSEETNSSHTSALPIGNLTPRCSAETANNSKQAPKERDATECVLTALRLFHPPHQAVITMRDRIPARIVCNNDNVTDGDILWQAGPWRSSGDWWEQEPWARDEWDIAVQGPAGLILYRLVHDLLSGCCFVEGTYD